jgi:heme-degrading monooxygenase HmoA
LGQDQTRQKWDEFVRQWNIHASSNANTPGLRGRLLLRDTDNKDEGFSIAFSDSVTAFESYAKSRTAAPELEACFVGEYVTTATELSGSALAALPIS